jgi:hypothetical protein
MVAKHRDAAPAQRTPGLTRIPATSAVLVRLAHGYGTALVWLGFGCVRGTDGVFADQPIANVAERHVADELSQRERALRRLPLPYSLALRPRDAGISAEVICQYVNVEQAALDDLYRMAEAKLLAAQNATDDHYHGCQ